MNNQNFGALCCIFACAIFLIFLVGVDDNKKPNPEEEKVKPRAWMLQCISKATVAGENGNVPDNIVKDCTEAAKVLFPELSTPSVDLP